MKEIVNKKQKENLKQTAKLAILRDNIERIASTTEPYDVFIPLSKIGSPLYIKKIYRLRSVFSPKMEVRCRTNREDFSPAISGIGDVDVLLKIYQGLAFINAERDAEKLKEKIEEVDNYIFLDK